MDKVVLTRENFSKYVFTAGGEELRPDFDLNGFDFDEFELNKTFCVTLAKRLIANVFPPEGALFKQVVLRAVDDLVVGDWHDRQTAREYLTRDLSHCDVAGVSKEYCRDILVRLKLITRGEVA